MTTTTAVRPNISDDAWVVEVLKADDLKLAKAKRAEPYGRATLGKGTRVLLWAMRLYVLFSVVLIAAQVYISLHAR
jgi:hypothetical protein